MRHKPPVEGGIERRARGKVTRQKLLEAARFELAEHSGAMELAAVAKRAGVSAGLPYRYFDSKSALVVAVVESFFDAADEAAYRPTFEEFSDDWWARERHRIDRMVSFFYEEPLGAFVVSQLAGDADVVSAQHRRVMRQIRGATTNVRTGQSLGRVPAHIDPAIAGPLLMGGVYQTINYALTKKPRAPKAKIIAELQAFMRKVLEIEEEK